MKLNAEVKHVPGKHIVIADALSGSPVGHSPADKDIDHSPVRCRWLLMRLMKFNAEVKHVPGKHIFIADALSRSPLDHSQADKDTD